MMDDDTQHHISQQFNVELRELRNQVLSMGGLVEEQLANALQALTQRNDKLAEQVYTGDYKINALEVAIDEDCTRILALRQPTASDLRLVLAVEKTITDLERIGDEAESIAKMSVDKDLQDAQPRHYLAIRHLGEHVRQMLHDTLDSFARMDVDSALMVIKEEAEVDDEYENISRQLITYMMEDPRAIPIVLNILWSARALERIADHTCNICQYVIFFVRGKHVRHHHILDKMELHTLQGRT